MHSLLLALLYIEHLSNHLLAPGGFLKTREQGADRYKKKRGRPGVDMEGM